MYDWTEVVVTVGAAFLLFCAGLALLALAYALVMLSI